MFSLFGKKKNPADVMFDRITDMKMQSKMLDSQARKTEQEIKQLKKKVTFEISRGNQEGARIYCDMIVQKKNHYRNLVLMSAKISIAANEMKVQIGTGDALKSLVKATDCMKDFATMQDSNQVFQAFAEFNKSMENQYVSQQVMNSVFTSMNGEEQSTMANELFEEAQMAYANADMGPSVPLSQRESVADAALEKRIDELLPPLFLVCSL